MKWVIALAGFIALGIAGIYFDAFVRLPGGSSASAIENVLQTNAMQVLRASGMDWAHVKVSGQMAHLTGEAPSEAERDEACDVILRSQGHGGIIRGGITTVSSKQVLITTIEPTTSSAVTNISPMPVETLPDLTETLPETEDVLTEEAVDTAEQCQQLFTKALSDNAIHFETSKADITPDSFELMGSLAQIATRCSAYRLLVTGHTDWLGDPAFNDFLSAQRAQAVSSHLVAKGTPETQISSHGVGSREPLCPENTRSCRRRNRRIEITVEQEKG